MNLPPQRNRQTPPGMVPPSIGVSIQRAGESAIGAGEDAVVQAEREVLELLFVIGEYQWSEVVRV